MERKAGPLFGPAAALALALVLGCGGPVAPSTPLQIENRAAQTPPLPYEAVFESLPSKALVAVVARSPHTFAQSLGWPDALRAQGSKYDRAVAEISQATGHNLLDPSTWNEIGVDANAPFGLAVFDADQENITLFATLSDPDSFQAFLDRALRGELGELKASNWEDSLVILPERENELAFVLRHGMAYAIWADRADDLRVLLAHIARGNPEDSLAGDAQRVAALTRLDASADVTGLIAFDRIGALIAREARDDERWDADTIKSIEQSEQEAAAATRAGDTKRAEGLHRAAEETRSYYNRSLRRRAATIVLSEQLIGGAGTLGVQGTFRGGSLALRASTRPVAGSLFDRLVGSGAASLALPRVLTGPPVFAVSAHPQSGAVVDALAVLFEANGVARSDLFARLIAATRIDVGKVAGMLDGELGIALPFPMGDGDARHIDVVGIARVRDPATARSAIDDLAANPGPSVRAVDRPAGKALAIAVPGAETPLIAELAGRHIVAATAGADAGRVSAAPRAPWRPAERALWASDKTVAMLSFNPLLFLALVTSRPMKMPREEVDETTLPKQVKQKLASLDADIARLSRELATRRATAVATLARTSPRLSLAFERSGATLNVRGGVFTAHKTLARTAEMLVRVVLTEDATGDTQLRALELRLDELTLERWQLQREHRRATQP